MNDKFIGTTVAKKITVNILNPNNQIDLEDKEIEAYTGIIIDGKEESVPFGNFIIEKPESEEVKEKTNFVGYDYMIKFNILYENRVTYPIKASVLFEDVCLQAGVKAGSIDFVNCDYMILGNPFTNNENCRTVLSNIAQLAGGFAHIGRDNKVYIVALKNTSKLLRVKDINFMFVKDYNITPVNLLSTTKSNADEKIDGNSYFEDFSKNTQWGEVNSLILRVSGTEGENNTIEDKNSIVKNGLTEIVIEDNYFLNSEAERIKVINPLWNKLKGIKYLPFKTKYYGYPYLDVGDMIYIEDSKDNGHVSYVMNHTFTFNGTYEGTLETPALTKTQTAYKNTVDVKTKFKQTERVIDKINGVIKDIIEENSETSNKLTLHEQTIDSMKDTLKSQETKIKTAQSTANTANSTANSAKTKADSNATKIQTTTTKLTEVEETVDGITQSVSSVEEKVETVENTANTAKTSAENANSKIDNLQVGGRNFLTNTATEKSVNVNKASGYITFDPYSTNNKQTLAQLGLKAGDKVTISFNWKISKNASLDNVYGNFRLEWLGVNETSQSAYLGAIKNPAGTFSASNTTGKITVTIALTATTVNAHTVRIRIDNSVLTFTVSNMKLEAGNMATDWTPAPEDIENNLSSNYYTKTEADSQIQQKADSITTSVNKKITEIQVDADNLLLNTALKKDASNFSLANGVTRVTDKLTPNSNYCFKYNISGLTADAWRSANPTTVELNAGEIVTASANVYVPSGVTNSSIRLEIQYFNASNSRISVKMAPFIDLTKTNQWQRTYITDTAPAGTVKANARVWILRNGQCWVGDLKLGRGNTVTSWCPSSKDYPTTKEFGTLVEQNWEHVKVAWNTICEYLQLENLKGNASLVVRDVNGKLIMSLDKTGQHYWTQKNNQDKNIAETTLKDITINNQTKKALMFLLDNAEMNGEGIMAWGYKSGNNVYPVLYVGNFGNEEFGLHLATDLIAHANAIKFQNAQIDDDGANLYLRTLGALKVMDIENNTWIGQIFKDEGNYGFSIKADDFSILDSSGQTPILATYTNENGEKTLNLFDNSFFAKNIHATSDLFADGDVHGNNIAPTNNCDYIELVVAGNSASLLLGARGVESTARFEAVWVSDARLKKDVKDTNIRALELINKIEHREFNWKEDNKHEKLGYIAQELEEIDSNFVKKYEVKDENENVVDYDYTINDKFIISLLTKGMQEQQEMIDKQQAKIDFLMKKIDKKGEFKFESKIKKTEKVKEYGEKIVIKRKNKYEEKKKEIIVKNEEKKKEILNKLNKKEVKAKA